MKTTGNVRVVNYAGEGMSGEVDGPRAVADKCLIEAAPEKPHGHRGQGYEETAIRDYA
jgi:hypothetical protein